MLTMLALLRLQWCSTCASMARCPQSPVRCTLDQHASTLHHSAGGRDAGRHAPLSLCAQDKLVSEGLGEWQGPAIFFYNSQPAFTSADLDCFTRSVGDSAKAGDSSKIGQFGLGAKR